MSGLAESLRVDAVATRLPRVETPYDGERETLVLAAGLIVGLVAFVPAFGALVSVLDLPIPLPLLVGVALVVAAYGATALLLRRVVAGTVVALVVLATFKANVPVLAAAHQFPKDVVGDLLLVHLPLAVAAVVVAHRRWYRSVGIPAVLFAAFVLATTVPVLSGTAPAPLAAASFALFAALGLLTYVTVAGAVADDVVRFETVVQTFLAVVSAHAAVGVLQFLNQGPFGLTRLGEGGPLRRVAVDIPVVGRATIGPYVSGFTGMSFVLAYLVVLVAPAAVVVAVRRLGRPRVRGSRVVAAAWILVLVGVIRASASDAARGALLVALCSFAVLLVALHRPPISSFVADVFRGRNAARARSMFASVVVAVGTVVFLSPSTATGSSPGSGTSAAAPADAQAAGETGGDGAGSVAEGVGRFTDLSLPFVSLANLDVRLLQYVAAVDVFARHPLFGIGGMNWVRVASEYGFEAPWNQNFPVAIHSVYFTLLAETGAVGTGLYLGAIATVLYGGLGLAAADSGETALVLAVLAGLVGALAYSAFGVLHLYAAAGLIPFWALAGALAGHARAVDASEIPFQTHWPTRTSRRLE